MKKQINDIRDYAELSWASYFNLIYIDGQKVDDFKIGIGRIFKNEENQEKFEYHKALSKEHKGYFIYDDSLVFYPRLNGEFGELQAKAFAKRYQIIFHQPNTSSGFSATLFYDTQKERFIVAFRGTEKFWSMDTFADIGLVFGKGDFQANDLKQFLLDIAPILNNIDSNKIIFVGHSLGGYLAVIAMQFCDTIDKTLDTDFKQIKFSASKVYTFNSPAIDGIDNMLMKVLATLMDGNIMEQVLNPQKVYCVYDNGGIKIIASAQYGSINRIPIYTGFNSHSIIPLTQTLYFHSYLLESSINDSIFQNNIHDILNALNSIVKSIYNILYNIEINKALQEGDYDDNNPISVNNPPHWLYATIDKTLFEATSKTNDNKKLIKNDASDVIDGILYLQDNEIYIKILSKNEIININISSPLANLFALHEAIFFTSVDKAGKPLISNNEIANKLIGYITPRTQIFCNNLKENSKDVIIKCYINKTLEYYPESIK
ncbi:hypothetical protein [Helicobacter saguini]|uniref:hypothetical protein n=1 Tax=Helicobacter saguini TaxID=1548018 RepID=UPI0019285DDC|nr:hypothetical protein [Helicobacter saguini]